MAAREPAYSFEAVFEGADRQRGLDAVRAVLRAPLTAEVALRLSEAHARECVTCRLDGQDACPDARWHLSRVERAMKEGRARTDSRTDAATDCPARIATCPHDDCGPGSLNSAEIAEDRRLSS